MQNITENLTAIISQITAMEKENENLKKENEKLLNGFDTDTHILVEKDVLDDLVNKMDTIESDADSSSGYCETIEDEEKGYEPDDLIAEVADNNIPIYTYDLLQYASNNFDLIQPSELQGDNPTVISIIQANIYEILTEELYAYVTTIQDKEKEKE